MKERIAECRASLLEAHRGGRKATLPAGLQLADAYAIQDAAYRELSGGARPIAWKVGSPSADVEPVAAQIVPGRLVTSPARLPARGLAMIGVEIEIAFRFARDVADPEAALDCVGEALVAIELCDTRLADFESADAMAKLADFQSNSALVTGSAARDWKRLDFLRLTGELWLDGRKHKSATGAHPFGDPARMLPWAARHCAARGAPLRAGDVVTTGSWTGMDIVPPGTRARAVFGGIGEAELEIAKD